MVNNGLLWSIMIRSFLINHWTIVNHEDSILIISNYRSHYSLFWLIIEWRYVFEILQKSAAEMSEMVHLPIFHFRVSRRHEISKVEIHMVHRGRTCSRIFWSSTTIRSVPTAHRKFLLLMSVDQSRLSNAAPAAKLLERSTGAQPDCSLSCARSQQVSQHPQPPSGGLVKLGHEHWANGLHSPAVRKTVSSCVDCFSVGSLEPPTEAFPAQACPAQITW